MFLNLLIEVILLLILVGGAYYGKRIGFFKIAVKPLKLAISILFSFLLCKTVGNYLIAPLIMTRIAEEFREFAAVSVGAISTAIAFMLLLFVIRIILSFAVSVAARFFDFGIIGRINKFLGFLLATIVALILAYGFALLVEFLFTLQIFDNSSLVKDFSGGILYRLFIFISRSRLLPSFSVKIF